MANNLEFGGTEQFAAEPEKLYALLTDLDAMAGTIPDLVSAERVELRTLKCVVRPGFSFLRGTMRLPLRQTMTARCCRIFEKSYYREIDAILGAIPHADLAIQWDLAIEIIGGMLGFAPGLPERFSMAICRNRSHASQIRSPPRSSWGCISVTAISVGRHVVEPEDMSC